MKNLNVNKETMVRLQDDDMANLVGATNIKVSNTSTGKAEAQKMIEIQDRAELAGSCCQKSCK